MRRSRSQSTTGDISITNNGSISLPSGTFFGDVITVNTNSGNVTITNAEVAQNVTLFVDYETQVGQQNFFAQSAEGGVRIGF